MDLSVPNFWEQRQPPSRWRTLPVSALAPDICPPDAIRLRTPYVSVPGPHLPNALPRPDRIKIEAAFRLGGDFCFLARVVRHAEKGTLLQVEEDAFDVKCRRRVPLEPTAALLARVYRELTWRYLAAQGRAYGRAEGRN